MPLVAMLGRPDFSLAYPGETKAERTIMIFLATVWDVWAVLFASRNATKMATTSPIALILNPISSATGAVTMPANNSAAQTSGEVPAGQLRFPVETPALF